MWMVNGSRSARPAAIITQTNKLRRLCSVLCVCLGICLLLPHHALAQSTIPDTPAGRILRIWLDAFNSGDRAALESYIKTYDSKQSLDFLMSFRGQTGGFELVGIESSEPKLIRFRVKEKASPTVAIGSLQLNDAQPPTVESLMLRAIPPGAVVENIKLDAAERKKVLDGIASNLKEYYVYPDSAQKMSDALAEHQKQGDYDAVTEGDSFATLLTKHLQDVSKDKHLHVEYSPYKLPPDDDHGPSAEEKARFQKQLERINCGFSRVEILPGNIGYLKFNFFGDPDFCGATVVAAMNFLSHADAIIFDLRENGGGDPRMVQFVSTYLFGKPTHLNDLYNRKEDQTTQYWTLPYVPGSRLADTPAFVLTSDHTFSGAEEFSYNLKNLKRATLVGETTGGGAHPVAPHRIDDHFGIGVPFARAINPVSKTNWEGTGVTPDVQAKASDALEVAEKLATEKVGKK